MYIHPFGSFVASLVLAITVQAYPPTRQLGLQRPMLDGSGLDLEKHGPKVNVTLYVMSRCPDARICEGVFENVFKTEGIVDKVNFDLGFIASPDKSSPLGLKCKHGPLECIGNAHQLCLQQHLPLETFYAVLSCMDFTTPFPDQIGSLELTKHCAEIAGVNWDESGVGRCIEGKKGKLGKEAKRALWLNAKRTRETGVERSCTIEIQSTIVREKKRVCVVDGGVWTGCDDGHTAADFVRVIEDEYKNLHSR